MIAPDTSTSTDAHRAPTSPASPVEAALRRYTPAGLRPPELAGGDVRYVLDDFAVGRMLLAARPDGTVLACAYAPADADAELLLQRLARTVSPRVLRGAGPTDVVRRQLAEYLDGRRRHFDLRLAPVLASDFQRSVLGALSAVGYGATTSYGAVAQAIGRPSAARAVGAALGSNPLCVLLPCHRVLAASGALTGYAGGLAAKEYLLALEAGRARHGRGPAGQSPDPGRADLGRSDPGWSDPAG